MGRTGMKPAGRAGLIALSVLLSSAVAFAIGAAAQTAPPPSAIGSPSEDGGHEDGGGRRGDGGHDDGGHDDGGHDDGGHDDGGHDDGGGGHEGGGGRGGEGGGGRGGEGGGYRGGDGRGAGADGRGGPPVWAREGIPEVELGRLNVVRAPDRVLDRAYAEALAVVALDPAVASFYAMSFEEMKAALSTSFADLSFVDSPLQNLALMRDALAEGRSVLASNGVTSMSDEELAAVFLGIASDKTIPVTADTVVAVTRILGLEVGADADEMARKAEEIRAAVAAGHG